MKESKKIIALRKLLEQENKSSDEIETTISLVKANEEQDQNEVLRSWIAVITGIVALIVSILVAILK